MEMPPPYFSLEALEYIVNLNINHLLVDLPSVDRIFDQGQLGAHHIFCNVLQGSHEVDEKNPSIKTITEMIYVPDEVNEGHYILNLQIPGFVADASPSCPIIYKVKDNQNLT